MYEKCFYILAVDLYYIATFKLILSTHTKKDVTYSYVFRFRKMMPRILKLENCFQTEDKNYFNEDTFEG